MDELRLAVDSRTALLSLGQRTGLDSLRRVTSTLAQTMQYGTPLTEALRSLSAEMRQFSLTRFEEKAARLPVMLTLPMILFIFPCVFIVIGGPAVLLLSKAFSH
jgi:tight adherence protein C